MPASDQLTVNAPSHNYPVFFGTDLPSLITAKISPYLSRQAVIVTNETIAPLYLPAVQTAIQKLGSRVLTVILPDGEQYKNQETLMGIYNELLSGHIERTATLLALGGGVIGDMAGFAAATFQRGIPLIQLPTTLLSQTDSALGGKTAVNHPLGKNMIGAFYQPQAVFIAQEVLGTLPRRQLVSGLAEVVKYALLGHADFFSWLENNTAAINSLEPKAVRHILYTSCQMKAAVITADETEQGNRALLNLGHTFAHAIEVEMGYGNWLHGEAVAAGLVLAAKLSVVQGKLAGSAVTRIEKLLTSLGLPVAPPQFSLERWFAAFNHDKKVKDGVIRFVTLNAIGTAVLDDTVTVADLTEVLAAYL